MDYFKYKNLEKKLLENTDLINNFQDFVNSQAIDRNLDWYIEFDLIIDSEIKYYYFYCEDIDDLINQWNKYKNLSVFQ